MTFSKQWILRSEGSAQAERAKEGTTQPLLALAPLSTDVKQSVARKVDEQSDRTQPLWKLTDIAARRCGTSSR